MALSSEKRTEILQLLAAGKITADEAADMLAFTPEAEPEAPTPSEAPKAPVAETAPVVSNGRKPKWLHVQVSDLASGKTKVKVNVPLRMVKFGLTMGKRFAPELDGLDWDDLSQAMTNDAGIIVDVQDEEDGEHVQIYVD